MRGAALAGRHAADHLGPVSFRSLGVERAFAARQSLYHQSC